MIKIESNTLEDAYKDASVKLNCSVNEIDIEIIQAPSGGVLGFFKKKAIVFATKKSVILEKFEENLTDKKTDKEIEEKILIKREIDLSDDEILKEVNENVSKLLQSSCFKIHLEELKFVENNTIYLKIDGEDAPLLIGKEGYRYKSFSFILYNVFKSKYNKSLKLEIAQFLEKQEEYIDKYLIQTKEKVQKFGIANTKILDGVLLKVALEKLRKEFDNKYVGIKTNKDGNKYIVINSFSNKKE